MKDAETESEAEDQDDRRPLGIYSSSKKGRAYGERPADHDTCVG
jgi:hypothetical protein